jgi:hypothetical protein
LGIALAVIAITVLAAPALAQDPTPTPPVPYTNPWGYGWGPRGMMGGWWGSYCGWSPGGMMGGWGWGGFGYAPNATPISLDQAVTRAQQYVVSLNNPDLALVEVMEFSNNFYGEVKKKPTGIHAFEFLVDKYTGAVYPEYGPNMMWNTKYSPMGWTHGGFWFNPSPAQNSITSAQAKQNAQQYLDTYLPGTKVADEADGFYGYYTIHVLRDGKEIGMLSVNGYTGAVWYHTWHGTFIQTKDWTSQEGG